MEPEELMPVFGAGVVQENGATTTQLNGAVPGDIEAIDDELSFSASVDKVQEVTEQIAEFLVNFSSAEQRAILSPFLDGTAMRSKEDLLAMQEAEAAEAHIDEARRFVWNFLVIYSECERDLIVNNWRMATDNASISSATESLTPPSLTPPSLTPPGSVTPTAVTPREFLKARRDNWEIHHTPSH